MHSPVPPNRSGGLPLALGAHLIWGLLPLYLWLPDGVSASVPYEKTARALGDHLTARNWSTMQKLLALMGSTVAA